MKRVTIYDVAKEAGVSLATVSRVINGSNVVKGGTRERVQAAVDKLGYKPNAIAQGLALQKSTTIGLVVPEASFTYTGQIINGLIDVAKIYNYNIMLHTITAGITDISSVVEDIIKSHVDGVVIYNDKLKIEEVNELSKYNIPIVMIGNHVSGERLCSVYVDNEKAIYLALVQGGSLIAYANYWLIDGVGNINNVAVDSRRRFIAAAFYRQNFYHINLTSDFVFANILY